MSLSKKLKLNVQTSNEEHGENGFMNESLTLSHFFTHSNIAPTFSLTNVVLGVPDFYLHNHSNSEKSFITLGRKQKSTLSYVNNNASKVNDYTPVTTSQDVLNLNSHFQNTIVQQKFENHSKYPNAETFEEVSSMQPMQSHFENLSSYAEDNRFQYMKINKVPLEYHSIENQKSMPLHFDNLYNDQNALIETQKHNKNKHKQDKEHLNIYTSSKIQSLVKTQPTSYNTYCDVSPNYQEAHRDYSEINNSLPTKFLNLINELNYNLESFQLPSEVKCIYNATVYARHTFEMYVRKYCSHRKPIMLFGMNPGPWGMSQTGVPFGEVNAVRDWLKIEGPVMKPPYELPMRPVLGFNCKRSEISGKRFWGLWKEICILPENFFRTSFVYNYLPQQWMTESGCNKTPSDFKTNEMSALYDICDPIFCKVLELYQVNTIVAIGRFCETRAKRAIKRYILNPEMYKVIFVPHPSPRTANSNNWSEKMIARLKETDLLQNFKPNTRELTVPADPEVT